MKGSFWGSRWDGRTNTWLLHTGAEKEMNLVVSRCTKSVSKHFLKMQMFFKAVISVVTPLF